MLNLTTITAEAFGNKLAKTYRHYFGGRNPEYATFLDAGARLIVERLSTSDALYHNAEHTVLVTLVGQDILRGKLLHKPVSPSDWLHFVTALLCHDIGYVRGVCSADTMESVVIDESGKRYSIPRGASDAILAPFHVNRGKIFVKERLAADNDLDTERIATAIELTRFPVPENSDHKETHTEAALVRAADLIGQMADPYYLRKLNALYYEFLETDSADKLGLKSPADLVEHYPRFFWSSVEPYIGEALRYLQATSEGRQWIANLNNHVFAAEHNLISSGPHFGIDDTDSDERKTES